MVDGDKGDSVSCCDSLSMPAVPATAASAFPPGGLGPGRHISWQDLSVWSGVGWSVLLPSILRRGWRGQEADVSDQRPLLLNLVFEGKGVSSPLNTETALNFLVPAFHPHLALILSSTTCPPF